MRGQIKKFNGQQEATGILPILYSAHTNWIGTKMFKLKDYCYEVEPEKPEIIEDLISKNLVR